MTERHIVATSSGGFLPDERYGMRPGPLMELCRTLSGADEPRVCALHTATGDDASRRAAWYAGVVLTGGTTDSFGPELRPWTDGLGLIAGSTCPHYDSESRRRPLYQQLERDGALDPGHATDDGVGLHYVDGVLHEAVSDREGACAWRVDASGETRVPARLLG